MDQIRPGSEILFDLKTPLNETLIRGHIAHAYSLGIPHLFADEPETLRIIANGPTAKSAPLDGPTLALNGALRLFTDKGLHPTWWAACDPQALVADFLTHAPKETVYLVASKCHADVFDRLAYRSVRLWDIDDYVPGGIPVAPSITLVSLMLAFKMGWRKIEVWGWDGCYGENGAHHAVDQPHDKDCVTIEVGARSFQSCGTWASEAQNARTVVSLMEYLGAKIDIKGDGMIDAIVRMQPEPEKAAA